jgi:hypothetical protein
VVKLFKQMAAVVEASNGPLALGPDDLADRAVIGAYERKWARFSDSSKSGTDYPAMHRAQHQFA